MHKQFIAPFRLGKKQLRAVLDSMGREVVIFPVGCEYFASEYVRMLNEEIHSYKEGKTAGDIAQIYGCAVGKLGCPHCGVLSCGAIYTTECGMCGRDMFPIKKKEQ